MANVSGCGNERITLGMEESMKGGKGGQGRKRSTPRVADKGKPATLVKKGSPKRDWGAIPNESDGPSAPTPPPVKRRGT
ncbi:MAG: hypothetical protein KA154_10150 [Gemmatimonadaceae bacterium]|nr:hypothetical protein [Gemmatimonadaceae bacterium]